jgi:cytochrome c biogenesis protein CcmG/thiol:disulfide interchange protein DsbE
MKSHKIVLLCSLALTLPCVGDDKKDREPPAPQSEPPIVGIGATLKIESGLAKVAQLLPDGPAAVSKELKENDTIVAVAEGDRPSVDVEGMRLSEIVRLIRGQPGSEVRLTVVPANDGAVRRKVISLLRSPLDVTKFDSVFYKSTLVGKKAPQIKFTFLSSGRQQGLSDFVGRIVVLDFWATWCVPCQKSLALLQTYGEKYPTWGERVALIAINRDDDEKVAVDHLKSKGWDKTLNAWTDKKSADILEVKVLPTAVIVDQKGEVVAFGNPNSMDIPKIVNELVDDEKKPPRD